ncbi:hypothetical protein LZ24_00507 [Desulfobotulus alkaliphilus]|uniref:Uncharacterized protein n=1 Tax=Desulfobotulus alkaliphilus TaxID=622671 RepID=A0A562S6B6_9BACT|nr:hypothetical protein [Desulfobotulus alkaliphilus]TWI76885.1 hypothetical protein LZ24_00507 [Desulfobotulus alkaliphilus]
MIPRLFTLAAVLCGILAVLTLIPRAEASKECLFGYRAICTFTPGSTFILGMMAYIFHDMKRKMQQRIS